MACIQQSFWDLHLTLGDQWDKIHGVLWPQLDFYHQKGNLFIHKCFFSKLMDPGCSNNIFSTSIKNISFTFSFLVFQFKWSFVGNVIIWSSSMQEPWVWDTHLTYYLLYKPSLTERSDIDECNDCVRKPVYSSMHWEMLPFEKKRDPVFFLRFTSNGFSSCCLIYYVWLDPMFRSLW